LLRVFALLALVLFVPVNSARASDIERRLRDEYRGKKFVIRNFYTGDRLRYDSSGNEIGSTAAGDWIADGLVLVRDIRLSHHHLTLEAERLLVVEPDEKEFQVGPENERELPKLRIESDLQDDSEAEAVLAGIFLTNQDSLANLVADYWKPCVREAASSRGDLRFSPDLLAIPGIAQSSEGPNDAPAATTGVRCTSKWAFKKGASYPRVIHQVEPQFSQAARSAHFQGTVVLKFVVDEKGRPRHIRVIKPIGHGLDEEAIVAVKQWVFAPAERDGQPIAMELAAEVDFHLY
jgi:TonB family protein